MPAVEALSSSTSSDTEYNIPNYNPLLDDQHTSCNSSDNDNTGSYQSNTQTSEEWVNLQGIVVHIYVASSTGAAIECVLLFLKYLTKAFGSVYYNPALDKLSAEISISVKTAEKYLGVDYKHSEYVVCPKCDSVYSYKNCVHTRANGQKLGVM